MPEIRYFGDGPALYASAPVKGAHENADWSVPEETPVALVYNQQNYAVMLATPADLAEFAIGFSLTEQIASSIDDIVAIDIHQEERGVDLRIKLTPECLARFEARQRRRNMVGRAGCGVCGLENADVFFEALPKVGDLRAAQAFSALKKAARELQRRQSLNQITRTVHGAAWATDGGAIVDVREDVGRHNALDKLLGAMALGGVSPENGFVVMSSRCSYELVEKAARFGVRALATISAPTAFAVRKAREANLALFCRAGDEFVELA